MLLVIVNGPWLCSTLPPAELNRLTAKQVPFTVILISAEIEHP